MYNVSAAGVRVVEFGTNMAFEHDSQGQGLTLLLDTKHFKG